MWDGIAKGIVDGLMSSKQAENRRREWKYRELEETPFLFSSGYLDELRQQATRKDEFEGILAHMYRHNANELQSYQEVERKIIDKYWR